VFRPIQQSDVRVIIIPRTLRIQSVKRLIAVPAPPKVQTLGSWVRIPLEAWMSVCVYSVCVLLCIGRGLAMG
jgi:hypothetical protein